MLKIIRDIVQMYRNKYDHTRLLKDIEDLNMIQHKHSLIIIRKPLIQKKKELLLYYDEKWDCKLFPNYKTVEINNEENIITHIAQDLNTDIKDIHCRYVASRVQEKYSVSHNENRVYQHRLYEVVLARMPEEACNDEFVINSHHYYWMSIEDMEKDENIFKKNLEVVDFVKENVI